VQHRIGLATICLHISAVLYLLAGLLFPVLLADEQTGVGMAFAVILLVVCLAIVVGIEIVAYGLHRRRYWAWIAGLCIFGLYLPSLFFPLGALGLWGLLDRGSQEVLGVSKRGSR
jgi:hypothetical protein